ncbi:MAG TPA: DUF6325 family protein [Gaiellaceae bacterium]|jgi:uncharacterized membrane protein
MSVGPIQMVTISFEGERAGEEVRAELRRLRESGLIRVLDLLFVSKREDGELISLQMTDLDEEDRREVGAWVGGLIGLGAAGPTGAREGAVLGAEVAAADVFEASEEQIVDLGEMIPPETSAAVVLFEHRWAIPLRDAILRAGGRALGDQWIKIDDLIALGADFAAQPAVEPGAADAA